jgi:hypothetical protein
MGNPRFQARAPATAGALRLQIACDPELENLHSVLGELERGATLRALVARRAAAIENASCEKDGCCAN